MTTIQSTHATTSLGKLGFFDIEGNGLWPACSVVHCVSVSVDGGSVVRYVAGDIPAGLAVLMGCERIVAHNGYDYDYPVLKHLYGFDHPGKEDTIILSRLFNPDIQALKGGGKPHSLKAWGMRLGFEKAEFPGPWDTYTEEMGNYCDRDVEVLVKLWERLEQERRSHNWELAIRIEYGMAVAFREQEDRGWWFHKDKATELAAELKWMIEEVEAEVVPQLPLVCEDAGPVNKPFKKDGTLSKMAADWHVEWTRPQSSPARLNCCPEIAGPFTRLKWATPNIASRDQLIAIFKSQGWKPTEFTEKGNPSLSEESLVTAAGPIGRLLGYRFMCQKRLALVEALIEGVRPDDRIPAGGIAQGTITGRATHRLVANIPRPDSPYGPEIRGLFGVPEGRLFGNGDAEGLELRMLAHDMGDAEFTEEVLFGTKEAGTDIHTKNVHRFGLDPTNPKARNGQAKPGVYAMLYGGGDEKLGHTVDVYGEPADWYFHERKKRMVDGKAEAFGAMMRESFLTALPKFAKLLTRIEEAVEEKGYVLGADGRKLFVRHSHTGLNTRLQGNGTICVKVATLKWLSECRKAKLDAWMVGHFHDEVCVDGSPDDMATAGMLWQRAVKWAGEFLKMRVPLSGSWGTGTDWSIH